MAAFENMMQKTGMTPFANSATGAQRQPGMPRMPEAPGLPATASQPAQGINPPGAASGPQGRPTNPPESSFGTGVTPLPLSGQPRMPGQSSGQPQAPTTGTPVPAPQGATTGAVSPETQPVTPVFTFDRIPNAEERAGLGPGVKIMTPYGEVTSDGNLIPTPEGAALYQKAVFDARKNFGMHPWAGNSAAPPPPVKPGGVSFNMFTGKWVDLRGGNSDVRAAIEASSAGNQVAGETGQPVSYQPPPGSNPWHPPANPPMGPQPTPQTPGSNPAYLWAGATPTEEQKRLMAVPWPFNVQRRNN